MTENIALNKVYQLIEEKIISQDGCVTFKKISEEIYNKFEIDINHIKIAELCAEISKKIGIPLKTERISERSRAMRKMFEIAETLGITEEEVYLSRIHGYSYQSMCESFYEITGKIICSDYFQAKYIKYCKDNGLPIRSHFKIPTNINFSDEISRDGIEHSSFFIKLHSKPIRRTPESRIAILDDVYNPYKKTIDDDYER